MAIPHTTLPAAYWIEVAGAAPLFPTDGQGGANIDDALFDAHFASTSNWGTIVEGFSVDVGGTEDVELYNATDPTTPVLVDTFQIPGTTFNGFYEALGSEGIFLPFPVAYGITGSGSEQVKVYFRIVQH